MADEKEVVEGEELEGVDVSDDVHALAVLNRSEIDMQVATAKKWPRSIALAKRRMIEMATMDEETARSCGYSLKRNDKGKIVWIEGPSIRLAEIAASCWGNIRIAARKIGEDDRFVTAQGACNDVETNMNCAMEVTRGIVGQYGRYSNDMIALTSNAACGIALRNAILKVIPRSIVNSVYKEAMKAASGDDKSKTFSQKRLAAVAAFKAIGVTLEEMLAVLDKPVTSGTDDIDTTDLRRLHGLLTAITDGETTVEQVFRPQKDAGERLNEKINKAAGTNPAGPAAGKGPAGTGSAAATPAAAAATEPAKTAPVEDPLVKRRNAAIAAFKAMNVSLEQILEFLGHPVLNGVQSTAEKLNADDLSKLHDLMNEIREGKRTTAQIFGPVQTEPNPASPTLAEVFAGKPDDGKAKKPKARTAPVTDEKATS